MTWGLTRRGTLEFLAAGAFAGLLGAGRPARGATLPAPPNAPMLFTRQIVRELPDGLAITVRRGFEIRFLPLREGYRVEGGQVSCEVDAPADIAALAAIERSRVETGLFPFDLDRNGLVLFKHDGDQRPTPELAKALEQAVDAALGILRDSGQTPATIADAQRFYLWLQQTAGTIGSVLPPDLFVPPPQPQTARRVIELPGGETGTIETRFSGSIAPETGLMREAERMIVTTTEGSSLRSIESWTLSVI